MICIGQLKVATDGTITIDAQTLQQMIDERIGNQVGTWEKIGTITITDGTGTINISKNYKKVKLVMDGSVMVETTEFFGNEAVSVSPTYYHRGQSSNYLRTYSFYVGVSNGVITINGAGWSTNSSYQLKSFTSDIYGLI